MSKQRHREKWNIVSCVWLFVTLWTVPRQAPLFTEFTRQEHWSGLPLPFPGDFPNPGIEPRSCNLNIYIWLSELSTIFKKYTVLSPSSFIFNILFTLLSLTLCFGGSVNVHDTNWICLKNKANVFSLMFSNCKNNVNTHTDSYTTGKKKNCHFFPLHFNFLTWVLSLIKPFKKMLRSPYGGEDKASTCHSFLYGRFHYTQKSPMAELATPPTT